MTQVAGILVGNPQGAAQFIGNTRAETVKKDRYVLDPGAESPGFCCLLRPLKENRVLADSRTAACSIGEHSIETGIENLEKILCHIASLLPGAGVNTEGSTATLVGRDLHLNPVARQDPHGGFVDSRGKNSLGAP